MLKFIALGVTLGVANGLSLTSTVRRTACPMMMADTWAEDYWTAQQSATVVTPAAPISSEHAMLISCLVCHLHFSPLD